MLIIGSKALQAYGVLQEDRIPNDVDIICTFKDFKTWCANNKPTVVHPIQKGKKFVAVIKEDGVDVVHEFEIAWKDTSGASLLQSIKSNGLLDKLIHSPCGMIYANPDICYALKMSHRFLKDNPFFTKTMNDIKWLRGVGCSIPSYLSDWFIEREEETYWYKHPSLIQSKEDFFNGDGVKYIYDHDSIHKSVAITEVPAYSRFQADNEEVLCSRDKFTKLPFELQLHSVVEESYVLAIERCLLHYEDVNPFDAFVFALEKVCTSITSGWWREFAWENHNSALALFDPSFYSNFLKDAEKGTVLPYSGSQY